MKISDIPKEEFVKQFAIAVMAGYAAKNYDDNCYYGWREKEKYLPLEEAVTLAEQAYKRELENES